MTDNAIYLCSSLPDCKSSSPAINFISVDLKRSTGYIDKVGSRWKMYISGKYMLDEYKPLLNDNKYYFYSNSLTECCLELEKLTGRTIDMI
ncbi:MAG: hypothetical protein A2W93_10050 [Bacteroidetes bacterium GWF2_43_63]|nr:MAG: hypothetical protein A2W94_02420 [Bacteroidetes bacterium GWE2_42_42]OFY52865.1 MAG: hypothetical protein A2W93_10050 [Bacteroidetes bacterium GWF2_43_63]HBG70070.1 hypothetical protein [Bacteroidales bacterium]